MGKITLVYMTWNGIRNSAILLMSLPGVAHISGPLSYCTSSRTGRLVHSRRPFKPLFWFIHIFYWEIYSETQDWETPAKLVNTMGKGHVHTHYRKNFPPSLIPLSSSLGWKVPS